MKTITITTDMREKIINNEILIGNLQKQLKEKDLEIDSLKSQINFVQEKEKEKAYKIEEELINVKERLKKTVEIENKYAELTKKYQNLLGPNDENGEKNNNLQNHMTLTYEINKLKEKNEFLTKSNTLLKNEIDDLHKSSLEDKDKINQLEIEVKQFLYEKNELSEKLAEEHKERMNLIQLQEQNSGNGITLDKLLEQDDQINIENEKNNLIIQNLKNEIETLNNKNIKLTQENHNLLLNLQKNEMENKKLSTNVDSSKNETKCLNDKIDEINKNFKNEKDKLKKEISDKAKSLEKVSLENKKLMKEIEILKNKKNVIQNKDKKENKENKEIEELKKEIQNLNMCLLEKEEKIKNIKSEKELTNDDVDMKLSDLDFYKKLYEEQKKRVNKEHELISDSLYKLAVHFMSLKDDFQKKVKK